MQNSRTLERSRTSTNIRFDLRAIALAVAIMIGEWGCGGGSSQPSNIQVSTTPSINAISPNNAVAGGAAFTLTINGANFVASSMVNFGGVVPPVTFVNSTQLTAAIPTSSIVLSGTLTVTVTNPAPSGGTSNASDFTVSGSSNSLATLQLLYPSCAPAGVQFVDSVDNQLTVVGQNFTANSVVRWNGSDRPTTGNGSVNGLIAQISASDIAAAGTAAVTVFNPGTTGGISNSLNFTITTGAIDPQSIAVDPTGKFAYVLNGGCGGGAGSYVSMYTINPTTGALATIGPPVSTSGFGDYPGSIAVEPSGKFALVTNEGDPWGYEDGANGSIAMYTIDATTGALTPTGTINGNCPGLCDPSTMVVDPTGKFAYVETGGAGIPFNLAMYTIEATTGALTPAGTITSSGLPVSVAVDPAGEFAYVATQNLTPGLAGSVSMYTINATTGAFASIGTIAAEAYPTFVTVDPTGKFAYVTNSGSNDVSMYTINTTTGALTSTGSVPAGTNPISVAVDPSGKFAYVANINSNDVSMYTINATTGALTSTGTIATGTSPTSIAVHPSGMFAYVTDSATNEVSIYTIDVATGALTLIGTIGT